MFNNASLDKQLLDCLDWLEHADTVDVDLPGVAANDQPNPAYVRAQLIELANEKVMRLIHLSHADILDDNNPMVSVTRKVDSRGQLTITRRIEGDKIGALVKLLKLTGGYRDGCHGVQICT